MARPITIRSTRRNPFHRDVRLRIFQAAIALSFIGLAARVYVIQFVEREIYVQQADENRFDTISLPTTRGIILDRNGVALAVNVASANVTVTPALLPADEAEELVILERLAGLIRIPLSGDVIALDERGFPQRSLLTLVREGQGIAPFRPVVVRTDVPHDIARIILQEQGSLPGVDIEWVSVRQYPTGPLTSQIIGYMGPIPARFAEEYEALGYVLDRDRIGYDGVEFSLEEILGGVPGLETVERDVAGEIIRTIGEVRQPEPGFSVRLTIDTELQQAAQQALIDEIEFLNTFYNRTVTERGVVIAMNPRTGEVLAMVSWPTYDNERFARTIDYPYYVQVSQDPLRPLFNQAIGSLYPPGSVFKVVTLTAALEEGVISADQQIFDPGQIELENRYYPNEPSQSQTFVCWIQRGTGAGHGYVDAIRSLAWSCDVYFYKIGGGYLNEVAGIGLGIERLAEWMEIFGLGQFTGIELAGEIDGTIPDPAWKRVTWGENWSTGDTYNSAFGQGYVTTTPLQMLQVLNTIANDGVQTRPTLVYEILDANGRVVRGFQPEITGQLPASQQTLDIVQEGMRQAVLIEGGTALGANLPYVAVAGKTGTAEYCDDEAAALDLCVPGNWPAHAWFMAYAPYINPEISVIAFVYNGNEGALVALPVAVDVLEAYFRLKTERALQQQAGPTPSAP